MHKILHCAACQAALTVPLAILSGKDPAVSHPQLVDMQPCTARGEAFKSYKPIAKSYGSETGEPGVLDFVPQYWINPGDLTQAVQTIRRSARCEICFGESGAEGPNRTCRCGAKVGTLILDCWTAHMFIPRPEATFWEGAERDG